MFATPDKLLCAFVTIAACLLYTWMAIQVSRARGKYNVPAPAMSGQVEFERTVRVHQNTLESLPVFFAMLWLAVIYFQGWLPGIIGIIWIVGRVIYMIGYNAGADKRAIGFIIAQLSVLALLILALIGTINAWMAVTAGA